MKTKLFLIIAFLLSFAIRIYNYNYPPLLWDEASLGYNAYSILKTGRDEYGQLLPLIFKSFGDYKPGLYVYLTVPFVAIFGLNELSTRLPSIILGSLLPILLYFFILHFSKKNKLLAQISCLICIFNPYNIHFSRGAWETNILTVELLLASLLFFKKKYVWSSIIFGLSLYTYQGAKLFSLFLLILLVATNYKQINIKKLVTPVIILFIFSIPILYGLIFQSDSNRLQVMSLSSYSRPQKDIDQIISETSSLDYYLFHNQLIFFTQGFLTRYFNHISPEFLFFIGDWQNARHGAPYIGVLLYPSLVFLVIGLILSLIKKNQLSSFMLIWLLFAPIPASLTRDSVSSVRIMSMSIPLIYFISFGIDYIITKFKSKIVVFIISTAYLLSFIYYSDLYYNHLVKKTPHELLYGYKSAISYIIKNQNKYENIYFTPFYGQPYIYYLFYSQYPPEFYQKQANLVTSGNDVGQIKSLDNIKFEEANFNAISQTPKSLAIFSYDEMLRQNIDVTKLIPLSSVNNISTFYAYQN